jgi:hypothetical protein
VILPLFLLACGAGPEEPKDEAVVIFYSHNVVGEIEPCG